MVASVGYKEDRLWEVSVEDRSDQSQVREVGASSLRMVGQDHVTSPDVPGQDCHLVPGGGDQHDEDNDQDDDD